MGTGGSRYGAGRPGWRRKCERSMPFDIRQLARHGRLTPGQSYSWQWSSGADPVGSVNVRVESDRVILSYRRNSNGEAQWTECTLWIERCAGGYGSRRMFACPRCGQRCAIVYFGSNGVACRKCLRLVYLSESGDAIDRLWRKQRKIERRLAGKADKWDGWRKPKGMHQVTFDRLREKIGRIEQKRNTAFVIHMQPFLRRHKLGGG